MQNFSTIGYSTGRDFLKNNSQQTSQNIYTFLLIHYNYVGISKERLTLFHYMDFQIFKATVLKMCEIFPPHSPVSGLSPRKDELTVKS